MINATLEHCVTDYIQTKHTLKLVLSSIEIYCIHVENIHFIYNVVYFQNTTTLIDAIADS
jgi:hypothetical protein